MNNNPVKTAVALAMGTILLSGCIFNQPSREPTAEEKAQAYEMRQAFIERLRNNQYGKVAKQPQPEPEVIVQIPKVSEEELAKQVANLNEKAYGGIKVERVRDGLLIDGQAYLDPEGVILDFAVNSVNGNLVYVVKVNHQVRKFKFMNAGSDGLPVTLGKAVDSGRNVVFYTASGQTMNGKNIIPTSKGVLVTRDASIFHYVPGKRVMSVMAPQNYYVAPVQRGDVGSTEYILLEKIKENKKANPIGSLMNALTSIGSTIGVTKVDDYVLYNIKSKNMVPLDISANGKNVYQYSNCKKVNNVVNNCGSMSSYNSLYRPDGTRNIGHYYWRVAWFNSVDGIYAIAGEGGARQINVINLNERKRATILERALGINGYNVTQLPDGKIAIKAKMGFSTETVKDAVKAYQQNNPVVIAQK